MKTEILKTKNRLDVSIEGRLDAVTSPELEEKLMPALDGIKTLVFDLAKLSVISSSGLRVLLSALQVMDSSGGTLTVKNASEDIRNVFRLTGFLEVLNVQ